MSRVSAVSVVAVLSAAAAAAAAAGPTQCPSPTRQGCALPSGPAWVPRWSMRGSLYTYCYETCPIASFVGHAAAGLGDFEGIVATDHYWTQQGMPCIDGVPQEFAHQDAWALYLKATFPRVRTLQYRIGTAVPYADVVHAAMVDHPDWFVRWHHAPQANGSVCVCPPEHQTGRPGDNCAWPISAGMYDFSQPGVVAWYIDNIIKPAMNVSDGVWLDGDGPDNGCYQCSGSYSWGKLPAPYPANNASEVDAFCAGETDMWIAAHEWLFANGGQDAQACIQYINGDAAIPARGDAPDACAAKLRALERTPADLAVGFASDRTGGRGVNPDSVAQVVASFLLVRGPHWYFGVDQSSNTVDNSTAALLLTDYGAPLGAMTNLSTVFSREFEGATVALDCATYTATFTPK